MGVCWKCQISTINGITLKKFENNRNRYSYYLNIFIRKYSKFFLVIKKKSEEKNYFSTPTWSEILQKSHLVIFLVEQDFWKKSNKVLIINRREKNCLKKQYIII